MIPIFINGYECAIIISLCDGGFIEVKKIPLYLFIGLCLLGVLVGALWLKGSKILVVKGGTLIDGTGNPPLEESVIFIINGKISAVYDKGSARVPLFARTIDAEGKYLIPGLVDMHVHFLEENFCDLFLMNGVTSVRDMGNKSEYILALRDRINAGERQGPTIFTSGYMLNNQKIPFGASEQTAVVKTPKQVREIIAEKARKKLDWIKIYISLPRGLLRTALEEAARYGIPVAGHLRNVDARFAAKWGIRTLEHATGISEALLGPEDFQDASPLRTISHKTWLHVDKSKYQDLIDLLIKNNVFITANLTLYKRFVSSLEDLEKIEYTKFMSSDYQKSWKVFLQNRFQLNVQYRNDWIITKARLEEFLIQFKNSGGRVLAGTDAPYPFLVPGFSLHEELELLVEAGFSPMEALLTATRYPAEAMGFDKERGTMTVGKTADIIILDKNPLEDIRNTRTILAVIKNGVVIERDS